MRLLKLQKLVTQVNLCAEQLPGEASRNLRLTPMALDRQTIRKYQRIRFRAASKLSEVPSPEKELSLEKVDLQNCISVNKPPTTPFKENPRKMRPRVAISYERLVDATPLPEEEFSPRLRPSIFI